MSSLIAEATDTDDQSPVKLFHPPKINSSSQYFFKSSRALKTLVPVIFVFRKEIFLVDILHEFCFQVRPAGRISQLLLTKSHKDQIEAKQENLKKEEEVKTNDRDGEKGEKRKSGSLANTSALKAKPKAEIKESMEREKKTEKLIKTTKNAEEDITGAT